MIMQCPDIKEEFDEVVIRWTKAIMLNCKQSCLKTTSIKKIIESTDFKLSCKFCKVCCIMDS